MDRGSGWLRGKALAYDPTPALLSGAVSISVSPSAVGIDADWYTARALVQSLVLVATAGIGASLTIN